jgi:hypothetical protein
MSPFDRQDTGAYAQARTEEEGCEACTGHVGQSRGMKFSKTQAWVED